MKFVVTLFWGFILGQVAFYIGSALDGNPYNFIQASILGVAVSLGVFLFTSMLPKTEEN